MCLIHFQKIKHAVSAVKAEAACLLYITISPEIESYQHITRYVFWT